MEKLSRGKNLIYRLSKRRITITLNSQRSAKNLFLEFDRFMDHLEKRRLSITEVLDYLETSGELDMLARLKRQGRPTGVH